MTKLKILYHKLRPYIALGRTSVLTLVLVLLPLIAFAQDDHDKPVPLDPQAQRIQLWTYGVVALGLTLLLVWYLVRRWQLRNAPVTNMNEHD